MRTLVKYAAALTLTGALALAAATPSQAAHGRNAAAIGGFAAGAVVGAAVANSNNSYYYAPGYGYDYGYAYDPGYDSGYGYDYAPAPGYYGPRYYRYRGSSEGNCTVSPATGDYTPCYNQ